MEPIDVSMLWTVLHHLQHYEVPYRLGGKAPYLTCDTSLCKPGLDCSGFVRYAIAKATNQQLIIPDGSATEHEWFEAQGAHRVNYPDIGQYGEGRLFIAFMNPAPIGHVWLVSEGFTLESYGHHGPGSRVWNIPMFMHIVSACYELPLKQ